MLTRKLQCLTIELQMLEHRRPHGDHKRIKRVPVQKTPKHRVKHDKKMKAEKAASYDAAVVDFQKSITQLEQTKKALQNLVDAEATAQVKLAEQGKDVESLRVEADGNAKAAQIVAEGQGQAALRSAEIEANAKAESSKNNVIWIILGLLVLAAIIVVVVRKIRKKGKKA